MILNIRITNLTTSVNYRSREIIVSFYIIFGMASWSLVQTNIFPWFHASWNHGLTVSFRGFRIIKKTWTHGKNTWFPWFHTHFFYDETKELGPGPKKKKPRLTFLELTRSIINTSRSVSDSNVQYHCNWWALDSISLKSFLGKQE